MSVNHEGLPAERRDPSLVRGQIPAVHRLAALAQAVHIEDTQQVIQFVMRGDLHRFPLRAFRHFAVPEQDAGPVRQVVAIFRIERHPDADGETLAERAGRGVRVREERGRVAFQAAAEPAICGQIALVQRARGGPQRVEQRRRVSLGEDQPVVVRVLRILDLVMERSAEQQADHQLRGGERRGRMSRAGLRRHGQNVVADQGGKFSQRRCLVRRDGSHSP